MKRRIAGVVAMLIGAACIVRVFAGRPFVDVSPPVFDLGLNDVKCHVDVAFTVRNRGQSTIKIAGCRMECGPNGCLTGDEFPFDLAAGESRQITLHYSLPSRPTFDYDGRLYTDAPGQREVIFHIVGRTDATPRERAEPTE